MFLSKSGAAVGSMSRIGSSADASFDGDRVAAAGDVDGGYALRARILRTRLSACYLPRPLELCATGSVGLHEVEPKGLTDARVGQAVFGAVGGLIAALVEVDEHVSVRFDLELAASLNQVSFTVVGANSWTVWPVIVELGVSFLYEP